ncbi:PH domain-containing protein [Laceyella putida]|uniref:PH domain-containing protein n=1 Tax=Laceyella putida TaxID=110101 RepID=A0ABW2RJB8_9BACL
MFGKVASDVLGLSDVGIVIKPEDYNKVDTDDYVMHEDNERIYFLIKSKADEYCFTNKALIHLDGTSAASKKRTLRRYDYCNYRISNVTLETAGMMDIDVEIKFMLGKNMEYSIDVHKKHMEELKDLYKALIRIGIVQSDSEALLGFARQSLEMASTTLSQIRSTEGVLSQQFKELNQIAFDWLASTRNRYLVTDYGFVFDRYINS